MEPVVVIPTFWTRRVGGRGRSATTDENVAIYDHPTPINEIEPQLIPCLQSLQQVRGLGRVVVIVAVTDESLAHQAEDRVREIVDDFPDIDAFVFGPAEMGSLHRRLEQLEFADMIEGVTLNGYGAVRNVGLIAAAVLGHDAVIFLDDDEVVLEPDFIEKGLYGLGQSWKTARRCLRSAVFTSTTRDVTSETIRRTGRTCSGVSRTRSTPLSIS